MKVHDECRDVGGKQPDMWRAIHATHGHTPSHCLKEVGGRLVCESEGSMMGGSVGDVSGLMGRQDLVKVWANARGDIAFEDFIITV